MFSSLVWLFTGLDNVVGRVQRMEQFSLRAVPRVIETRHRSGDEIGPNEGRRRVPWKQKYKTKKIRDGQTGLFRCDWGQQTTLASPPFNYIATFAGKTCQCPHMSRTIFCGTSIARSISSATSIFGWTLRAGVLSTTRWAPWETWKQSAIGSGFWGLHKWPGTEMVPSLRLRLWTTLAQSTSASQCLRRWCRHWWKHCI